MKEWQFFLEQKDTSGLISVNTTDSQLFGGSYRILAQTHLFHKSVEIRLDYQTTAESSSELFSQKYAKVTDGDGWLIITPFLELAEGHLQLRCQPDILSEMSGNHWEKYLTFTIIAPEAFCQSNQPPYCELTLDGHNFIKSTSGKLSLSGKIDLFTGNNLSGATITYELYNPKTGASLIKKQQGLAIAYLPGIFEFNLELNPCWNSCLILGEIHLEVTYADQTLRTSQYFRIIDNPRQLFQRFKRLQHQLEPSSYRTLQLIDFKNKTHRQLPKFPRQSQANHLQEAFAALELDKRFWSRINELANHPPQK
jgi:hypothetical protein